MKAMQVNKTNQGPVLIAVELQKPEAGLGEILVHVHTARYFREHFQEGIVEALFGGFAHKPCTTCGTVNVGICERFNPSYKSPNICDLIAASHVADSASQR